MNQYSKIALAPARQNGAFDIEANAFFNEYYDLTGKEFPACDQKEWDSVYDWFVDLKLAVYRERAVKEVYGRPVPVKFPIDGNRKHSKIRIKNVS